MCTRMQPAYAVHGVGGAVLELHAEPPRPQPRTFSTLVFLV